jgi:hypothetical protein
MSSPFSFGTRILAGGAGLLLLVLAVGFFLPGSWSAERSATLQAPPGALYALLDSPEGWRKWTPWPDTGVVTEGPARGPGARLAWGDRELGEGFFEIVATRTDTWVSYRVEVQGGAMRTEGRIELEAAPEGTRVTWREDGDFGRNPLMGYWARFMQRAQGTEMEKSLMRLEQVVTRRPTETAPPDSVSGGAAH